MNRNLSNLLVATAATIIVLTLSVVVKYIKPDMNIRSQTIFGIAAEDSDGDNLASTDSTGEDLHLSRDSGLSVIRYSIDYGSCVIKRLPESVNKFRNNHL